MSKKLKIFIVFAGCMLFRLLPLRAPNVEPIMASIMPLGRRYGTLWAFLFGVVSIVLYDLLTNFGSWTFTVAIAYGLTGVASSLYFKKVQSSPINFAIFAFFATIAFDLFTGVLVAPFLGQNMYTALMLQIPFTLLHLAGNIGFTLTLSPLLDKWFATSKIFSLTPQKSMISISN